MTVVGGLALATWNHPRSTQDVDLMLLIDNESEELIRLMASADFRRKPGSKSPVSIGDLQVSQSQIELPES